ncbi:MAG: ATP-binding cassette domain-containing protein, partial [Patescibacteria group bacterium]
MNEIAIKGAKENNLKNIDLIIPRGKIVCFVGVSGSGKSTIAFDIIAREGQRQYFESLPSFARRYLQKANRPDV